MDATVSRARLRAYSKKLSRELALAVTARQSLAMGLYAKEVIDELEKQEIMDELPAVKSADKLVGHMIQRIGQHCDDIWEQLESIESLRDIVGKMKMDRAGVEQKIPTVPPSKEMGLKWLVKAVLFIALLAVLIGLSDSPYLSLPSLPPLLFSSNQPSPSEQPLPRKQPLPSEQHEQLLPSDQPLPESEQREQPLPKEQPILSEQPLPKEQPILSEQPLMPSEQRERPLPSEQSLPSGQAVNQPEDTPINDPGLDIDKRIWMAGESGSDVVKRCVEKLKETRIFPDDKGFMERVAFVMSRNGEATFQLHTDGGIWQVSRHAFQDTKKETAHIRLPKKYQKLKDAFGIEWRKTSRVDLEIPMYSAIAARLYLSNFAESIPPKYQITKQQEYWWRFYMLNHESEWFMDQNDYLVVSQQDTSTEHSDLNIDKRIWMAGESGSDVVKRCVEKLRETRIFPDDKGFMERVAFVMSRNGEATFQLYTDGGIWQVSKYAFQDTKQETAHIGLSKKYRKLENAFGIKWRQATRIDLEIPMYSAIAARLYLSNFVEPIPPEFQQQDYWWRFYMRDHESKRFMDQNDFKPIARS